jgi:hypothetical protein
MPYEIKKVRTPKNSYKVCKKLEDKRCFSKKGLPYKRALAQMRAIIISELGYKKSSKKGSAKKTSKKTSKKPAKKSSKKPSKKMSKVKPKKPVKN